MITLLIASLLGAGSVQPAVATHSEVKHKAQSEGMVLFESFEAWDGEDKAWTPEGWAVEMKGEVGREHSWTPEAANFLLPSPVDGNKYYSVTFSNTSAQDEWLISPEVEVSAGMELAYHAYYSPVYLFSMSNLNGDTGEYDGEKIVSATLQTWVQPEGGEWQMLRDVADAYRDMNLEQLSMANSREELMPHTDDLGAFAGQKVRVAFRYVGKGGNTMFIDAISVGFPQVEDVVFIEPMSALYWGFERAMPFGYFPASIAQYPVYTPLTWMNYCFEDGVDFTWDYLDPTDHSTWLTSEDADALTLTYVPDYSTEQTKVNNFHYPHTLTAHGEGYSPTSYTPPYLMLQAGGTAEITSTNGDTFKGTLMPFDYLSKGLCYITCEDTVTKVTGIPVFGHDEDGSVDDYWLKYSMGNSAGEANFSHLTGIGNLFMASEAPLVVRGITAYAHGLVEPDAEFTATIYGMNAEMSSEFSTFTPIATATCTGADVLAEYVDDKGYIVLPFDFAEPAVVKATSEHPAYMFVIEGFRSEKVHYFAPFQAKEDNLLCMAYGLYDMNLDYSDIGYTIKKFRPVNYRYDVNSDGGYADPNTAFAIGLNAEYPWLTCETESVELTDETPDVTVALGSYYDGSALRVDAPEGIVATVSGRYDDCKLSLSRALGCPKVEEGEVTVSGPGVAVNLRVSADEAGIVEVEGDRHGAGEAIFDLLGRKVARVGSGIHIVNGKKVLK